MIEGLDWFFSVFRILLCCMEFNVKYETLSVRCVKEIGGSRVQRVVLVVISSFVLLYCGV